MKPLGIADLLNRRVGSVEDIALREVYFWCRSHKQTHKAGELCKFEILRNGKWVPGDHAETCIDVGPFMSEREANRCCAGDGMSPIWMPRTALSMEFEL